MFLHCCLLLFFLSSAKTTEDRTSDFNRFSLWPSVHNAATLLRIRRAVSIRPDRTQEPGPNEGLPTEVSVKPLAEIVAPPASNPLSSIDNNTPKGDKLETKNIPMRTSDTPSQPTPATVTLRVPAKGSETTVSPVSSTTLSNVTSTEKPKPLDLNSPGVVKRGIIVFGAFALMAVAYFIFYKRKNKNNDMNSGMGMNDANQFRYGVLQSEDMKDNVESTRVPLTMESEDEIDDDLEIFDLMQKKKSLSYVNLEQNDEEIVLSSRDTQDIEGDNLLLDIEDASSDTLINWSNNGSKSIL